MEIADKNVWVYNENEVYLGKLEIEGGYRYGLKYDFKQYITRRNTIFL